MSAAADARLALLCLYAEDAYGSAGAAMLEPAVDARVSAAWIVRGILTGQDALFRDGAKPRPRVALAARRVFYGWLLESKVVAGAFCVVVRGTDGFIEWLEDGEFLRRPHPVAGQVEDGFWGIYQSLRLRAPGAPDPPGQGELPLVSAIAAIVGARPMSVTGHSLGAALANYLAVDLARALPAGAALTVRLIASPRPGDHEFAHLVEATLHDCIAYAYSMDLVPRVPIELGYCPIPQTRELLPDVGVRIRFGAHCGHHAYCYAGLIDPSALAEAGSAAIDQPYRACIVASAQAA